jgi:transcriptional regulator of arginine metabolism
MSVKKKRLQEILDIIKEKEITNQALLIEELRKRGIYAEQSTLSRDIAQLGLVKELNENDVNCYVFPERAKIVKLSGMFSQAVKSIDSAMNTVVIKTYSGMATAVCASLDLKDIPMIVGTIAGDDTIFAVTRSEKDAAELTVKLRKLL